MNTLRGILFDNLGLKLVALLLAVLVYLNAYTDRPTTMIISFRVQVTDLADSLTLAGSAPSTVQAELRGTGKQLIRMRVTEPAVKVSLAGVASGHFERVITPADLPLPEGVGLAVDRMVSPRTLALEVDRRIWRTLPVAPRVEGQPSANAMASGAPVAFPARVRINGPEGTLLALDSLTLLPVSVAGKHDTVTAEVAPDLPDWSATDPARVEVTVPLAPGTTRRVVVAVRAPDGVTRVGADPARVTVVMSGPRGVPERIDPATIEVRWSARGDADGHAGRRVALHAAGRLPAGLSLRFEPDSVTLVRVPR